MMAADRGRFVAPNGADLIDVDTIGRDQHVTLQRDQWGAIGEYLRRNALPEAVLIRAPTEHLDDTERHHINARMVAT